jgi:hypothetical protein
MRYCLICWLFESLKILSCIERNVERHVDTISSHEELVNVPLVRNLYSQMRYTRTYAVLYIHEPKKLWAETAEHEDYAVPFGNKRCSET